MNILRKGVFVGTLLLFGAAGCADLDVPNLNAPDAERALVTPGDTESLVAGSFKQWWTGNAYYEGASFFLSTASFQHSSWPANSGAVAYSAFPRPQIANDPVDQFYGNMSWTWNRSYRALAGAQQGLSAIEEDPAAFAASFDDGDDRLARARAYGKFVQGMAHGSIALMYDRGFIVDEDIEIDLATGTISTPEFADPLPYNEVMEHAIGYFDDAIALATGETFTIPASWMGGFDTSADQLIGYANAMKARLRAAVARTPAEREDVANGGLVDWAAVQTDLADATTWDVTHVDAGYSGFTQDTWYYWRFAGWQQATYWIMGMADQSGAYQLWVNQGIAERMPEVDLGDGPEPFMIITDDQRYAQGATLEEQEADANARYGVPGTTLMWGPPGEWHSLANHFQQPARGTWRWSYYWNWDILNRRLLTTTRPEVSQAELDLLEAEAEYRLNGNAPNAAAEALVDIYRVAAGLDSSAGTNDSCVPRLPNGDCGDFFEQLKWEKRMETAVSGLHGAPWYFEGRGWGDLYEGTYLQFPLPCREAFVVGVLPCVTYGGVGGTMASPGSVYNWPTEG